MLTFKAHVEKVKAKVNTRNNLLQKLARTGWGAGANILRTTALALCFSTAEYACSVWRRSVHAKKIDTALNTTCRTITGCVRSTNISKLYLLAGIAPPGIRREAHSRKERCLQLTDMRHPLHGHIPTRRRLRSRSSFMNSEEPMKEHPEAFRTRVWRNCEPTASEKIASGAELERKAWVTLNRLRVGAGRCRASMVAWGFADDDRCDCGQRQTMDHLLNCELAPTCTTDDLWALTDAGMATVRHWAGQV